jgi:predicted transcriptional regulator
MSQEAEPKRDIYVIARFLEALIGRSEGMAKTHLANRTGLNYRDFQNYLAFLHSRGLVAIQNEDKPRVVITQAGRKLYRDIITPFAEMLQDDRLLGRPRWSE